MGKPVRIALAILLVALAGVVVWQSSGVREPVYQGRRLTDWLEQYSTNHWSGSVGGALDKQAETAIRQIGTNALPIYLQLLTTKESRLNLRLMGFVPKPLLARLHWKNAFDYWLLGAHGLIALGPDARSAVPALIALLNDKNPDVRFAAAFSLRGLGPLAVDALPSLVKCLDDPDDRVQRDVALGLVELQQPERVVPILVELLAKSQDPQHSVTLPANVIWALGRIGGQAKPAVPSLIGLLRDDQVFIRYAATNALKAIDPEAAARAGGEVKLPAGADH